MKGKSHRYAHNRYRNNDFSRVIIEKRKALPKNHTHYLLLKIIANALYGIFAELNKYEYGKNDAKIHVFSGDDKFSQGSCVVERPGKWGFYASSGTYHRRWPAHAQHAGVHGEERGGTYLSNRHRFDVVYSVSCKGVK